MRKLESVLAVALFLMIAPIATTSSIAAALAVVIIATVLAVVVGLERKLAALACAIAVLVFAAPAFADTASDAGGAIFSNILDLAVASVPGLLLALWAWFKAHAAQSAAKWDDEAVAMVEKIAQGVVNKQPQALSGADH
jgi:hypothetical protein